jgi:hypothetical protein
LVCVAFWFNSGEELEDEKTEVGVC